MQKTVFWIKTSNKPRLQMEVDAIIKDGTRRIVSMVANSYNREQICDSAIIVFEPIIKKERSV